ncbi:hypothetical protein [Enhygromyxa salina]|uniref:DUF5666 domain-containing protein n=1 Tax=Enhygromyxa salina TaxID=215803 RepID=A0A2S9YWJ9_9BACT|nr:hypothetical protein [Enhygromyxa salina]PRQ09453.1 hypothetical protein ENSA7_08180 [Enhygromyxa salina]
MTTHSLRTLPGFSFLIVGLALAGPACTGFIAGDDNGDAETTGDGDGDGDGDPGGDTTIYMIQQGASDGSFADKTQVSVKGVVVTSPVNAEKGLVFVEEPMGGEWSGISLYLWDEVVMASQLQPGDIVDLVGEYTEFFETSQIVIKNPGDIVVVGSVASDGMPGPDIVSAADVARDNPAAEPWEGVRVQINDAVIQESNDGFGQYLLVGDALVGNAFVDPLPGVAIMGSFASVTGPLHYSFNEFKLQPTGPSDLNGYMGPATPVDDTSIYDIRGGTVPQGMVVLLENVVASSGLTWSNDPDAAFYVQEPGGGANSGIRIYVSNAAGLQVAAGDDVTVAGLYTESFGVSQIAIADASAVTINSSGPSPAPEIIADPASLNTGGSMAEQFESVLVQVENVTVTNENPDAPEEYGEFEITGGLRVNDGFFAIADWTKPAMGASFTSIAGVLNYSYEVYKLEPRTNADLVAN